MGGLSQIYIADVKLERGYNATDWNNHPSAITEWRIKASNGSSKNLNDYVQAGYYYNESDSDCAYISNLAETGKGFFLLVEDSENTNYVKQTITHIGTGTTYIRIRNNGIWGSWKEIVDKSYVDNLVGSAITYIVGSGS
jgi:hypothetical protein